MFVVTIVYPYQAGASFDFDYYLQRHIPLARRLLGSALKGVQVERGLAGLEPDSAAAALAVCQLRFESLAAFRQAFAPAAEAIRADIPRYSSVMPRFQFSELLLEENRQPNLTGWYASAQ
ncbi:ethyl tert-butyl ether degradation protein EthD [Xenophilus sp. AP218F]|nr:EthD family reductase [Chromobacterium sp. ASV5]OWY38091.1 ethyl tert-butyl ether degradation protein EthD [Xenophilus sp. AP218F]